MHKSFLSLAACLWLVLIGGGVWQCNRRENAPPQTLEVAAEQLTAQGMHVTEIKSRGFTSSQNHLTEDDANLLTAFSSKERWVGKVRVCSQPPENDFPPYIKLAKWGGVWVFGDADLVAKITSSSE